MAWQGVGRAVRVESPDAARATEPPIMWTTPEPAKSTAPLPKPAMRPMFWSQPPPQTQFPATGYTTMETQSPMRTNPGNLRRSAMDPVGIVAAVSMKTIWKRK
jgi:hypothetical protein